MPARGGRGQAEAEAEAGALRMRAAGVAAQAAHWAEAAEAGGRPELNLALAGRTGGARLAGAAHVFHRGRAHCGVEEGGDRVRREGLPEVGTPLGRDVALDVEDAGGDHAQRVAKEADARLGCHLCETRTERVGRSEVRCPGWSCRGQRGQFRET